MSKKSTLVYSTESGRIKESTPNSAPPKGDGIVRLQLETKGRKGKGVTTIRGLELDAKELKTIAQKLKKLCGTGGSVKDWTIEIQGDQRDKLKTYLESQNYTVKIAGA